MPCPGRRHPALPQRQAALQREAGLPGDLPHRMGGPRRAPWVGGRAPGLCSSFTCTRSQTSSAVVWISDQPAERDFAPQIATRMPVGPVPAARRPDLTPGPLGELLPQRPAGFRALAFPKRSPGFAGCTSIACKLPEGAPAWPDGLCLALVHPSPRGGAGHGAFCRHPPRPKMLHVSGSKPIAWGLGPGVPSLTHHRPKTAHVKAFGFFLFWGFFLEDFI